MIQETILELAKEQKEIALYSNRALLNEYSHLLQIQPVARTREEYHYIEVLRDEIYRRMAQQEVVKLRVN